MGIENVQKYLVLSTLIWKLIRPIAVAISANTKNTTIDDDLIKAVDLILGSRPVEFEDKRISLSSPGPGDNDCYERG